MGIKNRDNGKVGGEMNEEKSRILVVDDELVNRDILARRLTSRGYLVESATDGQRALDLLSGERYDLVLLDIMMPVMDGLTALKKLRLSFSAAQLPVIMATARDGSEDVVAALGAGSNDYVTKPIDFPVLLARMDTQLRLKKATEELAASYERIKREIEAAARWSMTHDVSDGFKWLLGNVLSEMGFARVAQKI